jgi:hypothetical protein
MNQLAIAKRLADDRALETWSSLGLTLKSRRKEGICTTLLNVDCPPIDIAVATNDPYVRWVYIDSDHGLGVLQAPMAFRTPPDAEGVILTILMVPLRMIVLTLTFPVLTEKPSTNAFLSF